MILELTDTPLPATIFINACTQHIAANKYFTRLNLQLDTFGQLRLEVLERSGQSFFIQVKPHDLSADHAHHQILHPFPLSLNLQARRQMLRHARHQTRLARALGSHDNEPVGVLEDSHVGLEALLAHEDAEGKGVTRLLPCVCEDMYVCMWVENLIMTHQREHAHNLQCGQSFLRRTGTYPPAPHLKAPLS